MTDDRSKVYTLLTQLGVTDSTLLSCVQSSTNLTCGSGGIIFNNDNNVTMINTSNLTYNPKGVDLSELSVLYELTKLNTLVLPSNNLSGQIPSNIEKLTELKYLNLYNNQLSGEIPDSICNLSNLGEGPPLDLS